MRCPETGALRRTVHLLPGARRFRSRKALDGTAVYRSTHLDVGWWELMHPDYPKMYSYAKESEKIRRKIAQPLG